MEGFRGKQVHNRSWLKYLDLKDIVQREGKDGKTLLFIGCEAFLFSWKGKRREVCLAWSHAFHSDSYATSASFGHLVVNKACMRNEIGIRIQLHLRVIPKKDIHFAEVYSMSISSPASAASDSARPIEAVKKSCASLGYCRLYKDMQTVSICWIGPSKWALKYPCVPKGSWIWPVRPYLVCNSMGAKYSISSGRV